MVRFLFGDTSNHVGVSYNFNKEINFLKTAVIMSLSGNLLNILNARHLLAEPISVRNQLCVFF